MKSLILTLIFALFISSSSSAEDPLCNHQFQENSFPAIEHLYTDLVNSKIVLKEVIVAVIDSGVEANHPSLDGRIVNLEDGSHGISFIPSKDFKGTTEIARMVHDLKVKENKTPEEAKKLEKLSKELQKKRNGLSDKLKKSTLEVEALAKDCVTEATKTECAQIPDLRKKLDEQKEGLDIFNNPDRSPYNEDRLITNTDTAPGFSDHGTFVSGIIAGKRNQKGLQFNGIADNARIIVIKVLNSGKESEVDEQVAAGIRYAVDHKAKIINISMGKYDANQPQLVLDAFDYASKNGVAIVISAGNSGSNNDKKAHYPKPSFDQKNVFVVGSNTKKTNYGSRVDFHITETNDTGGFKSSVPGNGSDVKNGSSFSAAYTSGVLALALGMKPDLTPEEMRTILSKNTAPYKTQMGAEARQLETYKFLKEVLDQK